MINKKVISQSDMDENVQYNISEIRNILPDLEKKSRETDNLDSLVDLLTKVHNLQQIIDSITSLEKYRHEFEEEENKLDVVSKEIASKLILENINTANSIIISNIESFEKNNSVEELKDLIQKGSTDASQIRKRLISYISHLKELIKKYEVKFKTTFDPSMKQRLDKKIKELASGLGLYLDVINIPHESMNIKTIEPDEILDLYEEIKSMPESEERQNKIRQLEKMQKIMKSSLKISIREASKEGK